MRIVLFLFPLLFFSHFSWSNVDSRVTEYLNLSKASVKLDQKVQALRPILFEQKFKESRELSVYLYSLLDDAQVQNDLYNIQMIRALISTNLLCGEKLVSSLDLLDKIGNYFEQKNELEIAYTIESSRLLILTKTGQNKKALQAAAHCKRLGEKVDLPEIEGNMLLAEAKAHLNMEQLDDAKRLLSEAINIAKKNGWKGTEAKALSILGEVVQSEGDLSAAESFFQQSADVAMKEGRIDLLAEAQTMLGIVEFYRDNMPGSKDYFLKALENHRNREAHSQVCQLLFNLGVFHFDTGKLDEAIPFYKEGLELSQKQGLIKEEMDFLMEFANLEKQRKNYTASIGYFEKYIDLRDQQATEDIASENEFREQWTNMQLEELKLDKDHEINELKESNSHLRFWVNTFGFLSVLLLLMGGIIMARNLRVKSNQSDKQKHLAQGEASREMSNSGVEA